MSEHKWDAELRMLPTKPEEPDPEPSCPSKAIVAVMHGKGSLLFHYGNALNYWMEALGAEAIDWMVEKDTQPGVYVWSGTVHGHRDYWGEYDEELVGELRPITAEEWETFLNDEELDWDTEARQLHSEWEKRQHR